MLHDIVDSDNEPVAFPVAIDYGASFADVVGAGRYRYPDPDVTAERFWRRGEGTRTLFFRLLRTDGRLSHADAELALAATGLRAVTPLELLTVCAALPDLPVDGRVAALATVWHDERTGARRVPLVQRYNGNRYLDLHPLHFLWHAGDQFLVAPRDGATS